MLRLVIDDKIPFIREAAARLGECIFLPGAAITADDVREADVLITRTRTQVNRALLEGSKVQLVVTATIGHDHIDKAYLAEKGIAWHNCPGCNARSVAQYVRNSLWIAAAEGCFAEGESSSCTTGGTLATNVGTLGAGESSSSTNKGTLGENMGALGAEKNSFGANRPTTDKNLGSSPHSTAHNVAHSKAFDSTNAPFCATLRGLTVGIVGVGHVGTAVAEILAAEGCRVLRCDPPKGEPHTLADLAREADVISLHTPLTFEGEHATFHLADRAFFESLQRCRVFINAARGECADTAAVEWALSEGKIRAAVIDTWENEPHISTSLLRAALIATPHVAGYSADGKANGTRMSLEAVARHFGLDAHFDIPAPALPAGFVYGALPTTLTHRLPERALAQLRLYNPLTDTERLRAAPEDFEQQRGNYPLRREEIR